VSAKTRARKAGIEFNLNLFKLKVPDVCPVFGIPIVLRSSTKMNSPSFDRRDNSQGYTDENTRVISHYANMRKSSLTLEDVKQLLEYMSD